MMTIQVCIGSACHLKGSYDVIRNMQGYISEHQLEEKIELKSSFCLGQCAKAVSVSVNNVEFHSVSPETVTAFMKQIESRI